MTESTNTTRKGLKLLRNSKSTVKIHCDNCNCDRYSECGCLRKSK
jgi:hypothetical protein